MPRMTGGQALVKSLHREGVRVMFGLPGVQLYHALDPLYDEPDIRFVNTRHEQATTYMADGYARAGGTVGTALVVPGPGLLNASAGIGTAYAASSPVLVVSGQIERDLIGVERGVLHEVHDQLDTIRPITKWAHRVLDPRQVPEAVHEAFYQLNSGRPRPVEIEIPPDTLAEEASIDLVEPGGYSRPAASAESTREAVRLLAASTNPIIWAGGGAVSSESSDALLQIAEYLQAPVMATPEGKGVVSDRHYLALGAHQLRDDPLAEQLKSCDLVLAVGTRLATMGYLSGQQIVQIDIDPDEIGRNHQNTFGLVGDARRTLEELFKQLSTSVPARESKRREIDEMKARRAEKAIRVEPQSAFLNAIRSALPEDGILVPGMTQVGYYARPNFETYHPRTFLTSSYFGNLGFAYPVALGAKVAMPDRAVVAISGDGGFLFNSQELSTAVRHGINAVVVVFDDGAFGNVLRDQTNQFGGRIVGAELSNPDFVKLAQAYGANGVKADGPEELEIALRDALALDAPTLIHVPVRPMPLPD